MNYQDLKDLLADKQKCVEFLKEKFDLTVSPDDLNSISDAEDSLSEGEKEEYPIWIGLEMMTEFDESSEVSAEVSASQRQREAQKANKPWFAKARHKFMALVKLKVQVYVYNTSIEYANQVIERANENQIAL